MTDCGRTWGVNSELDFLLRTEPWTNWITAWTSRDCFKWSHRDGRKGYCYKEKASWKWLAYQVHDHYMRKCLIREYPNLKRRWTWNEGFDSQWRASFSKIRVVRVQCRPLKKAVMLTRCTFSQDFTNKSGFVGKGIFSLRANGTGEIPVSLESGENRSPGTQAVPSSWIFLLSHGFCLCLKLLCFLPETIPNPLGTTQDTWILCGKPL